MGTETLRVTVWNEGRHEKTHAEVTKVYPNGLHSVIAEGLQAHGYTQVRTATLDDAEHGLTEAVLAETDVLLWWGHMAHGEVQDAVVERVYKRVMDGMGLVVLHSGHFSKIFKRLMGTSCDLKWREHDKENERLWVVAPAHPIASGLPEYIDLANEEMYGEHFDIPTPDELVLVSWFKGGEVFRSGCCWQRGRGRVFYFRPGHETFPTYYDAQVRKVIANGVKWAAPVNAAPPTYGNRKPLEALD